MGSFNLPDDNAVARISEASIEDALVELASDPSVDAAFVACTSLRVCGIVERAEQRVGKPITSSTAPSPGIVYGSPGSATRSTGSAASSGPSSWDSGDVSLPRQGVCPRPPSHQSAASYLNEMSRRTR